MATFLKRYKLEKKITQDIINQLVTQLGIPEIYIDYAIYFKNDLIDYPELHLSINPLSILFNFIGGKSMVAKNNKKFQLDSKDVFSFIKSLPDLGYKTFNSGNSFISKWNSKNYEITIFEDSLIGDFLTISYKNEVSSNTAINLIIEKLEEIESPKLLVPPKVINNNKQVFNTSGSLSSEIINILHLNSIPIKNTVVSLNSLICSKSNDFSAIEIYLNNKFNTELVQSNFSQNFNFRIEDRISIIIPSYNSEQTTKQVLESIESQSLSLEEKKLIEVIVIDDGSQVPFLETLSDQDFYSFDLKISTSAKNQGLAKTRNIGMGFVTGFITIFIDSDILLPNNYIKEHYLRHKFIPNALILSFKENIAKDYFNYDSIKTGLTPSTKPNDSRLFKNLSQNNSGIYNNLNDQEINLLEETDYFKNFGYGRIIGNYDLSTMVIGHNLSIRTKILKQIGNFNTEFKGWGLEDSYFGIECIAKNMWIIPAMSCNVYHINHPPRSGSEEQKKLEFEENLKLYKKLINKPIN